MSIIHISGESCVCCGREATQENPIYTVGMLEACDECHEERQNEVPSWMPDSLLEEEAEHFYGDSDMTVRPNEYLWDRTLVQS